MCGTIIQVENKLDHKYFDVIYRQYTVAHWKALNSFYPFPLAASSYKMGSSSLRTLIAVWWLFALIISTTYSANLVAFLAVEKVSVPFKTLHDLSLQNEYKFGTLGASVWAQLFEVFVKIIVQSLSLFLTSLLVKLNLIKCYGKIIFYLFHRNLQLTILSVFGAE